MVYKVHIEPEHLTPIFVWAVRYAQVIYHKKGLSLSFHVPKNSYIGDTSYGIRETFVL